MIMYLEFVVFSDFPNSSPSYSIITHMKEVHTLQAAQWTSEFYGIYPDLCTVHRSFVGPLLWYQWLGICHNSRWKNPLLTFVILSCILAGFLHLHWNKTMQLCLYLHRLAFVGSLPSFHNVPALYDITYTWQLVRRCKVEYSDCPRMNGCSPCWEDRVVSTPHSTEICP